MSFGDIEQAAEGALGGGGGGSLEQDAEQALQGGGQGGSGIASEIENDLGGAQGIEQDLGKL